MPHVFVLFCSVPSRTASSHLATPKPTLIRLTSFNATSPSASHVTRVSKAATRQMGAKHATPSLAHCHRKKKMLKDTHTHTTHTQKTPGSKSGDTKTAGRRVGSERKRAEPRGPRSPASYKVTVGRTALNVVLYDLDVGRIFLFVSGNLTASSWNMVTQSRRHWWSSSTFVLMI